MHALEVLFWLFFAGTVGFVVWTFLRMLLFRGESRRAPTRGSGSLMGAAGAADSPGDVSMGFSPGDAGSSGDSGGSDSGGSDSGGGDSGRGDSGGGSFSGGGGDHGGGGGSGGW